MKYLLFLQWHLIFTLICVFSIMLHYCGIAGDIWHKDASMISYAIYAIFIGCSIFCGKLSFNICKGSVNVPSYTNKAEIGWFFSELCLTLGMIGTIVGFIMMLSGFNTLDIQNISTVQGLLSQLGLSMATALYTTIVGLVCGSVLKLQFFLVSLELDRIEKKSHEAK